MSILTFELTIAQPSMHYSKKDYLLSSMVASRIVENKKNSSLLLYTALIQIILIKVNYLFMFKSKQLIYFVIKTLIML